MPPPSCSPTVHPTGQRPTPDPDDTGNRHLCAREHQPDATAGVMDKDRELRIPAQAALTGVCT